MPEIVRFYGIIIKMFYNEQLPPHFHALYGEYNGIINIETLVLIEGDLPSRALKFIKEWAEKYKEELLNMWNNQRISKLPALD